MAILTHDRVAWVQCVREVRLGVADPTWRDAIAFYHEWLGLPLWPREAHPPGAVGLGSRRCGLLLERRHHCTPEPNRRRLSVVVSGLNALHERLTAAGRAVQVVQGLSHCDRRLLTHDPAGHLIELRGTIPF